MYYNDIIKKLGLDIEYVFDCTSSNISVAKINQALGASYCIEDFVILVLDSYNFISNIQYIFNIGILNRANICLLVFYNNDPVFKAIKSYKSMVYGMGYVVFDFKSINSKDYIMDSIKNNLNKLKGPLCHFIDISNG